MSHTQKSLATLAIILTLLVGYNFIGAQSWTASPASPPNNNAPEPINRGSLTQIKAGNIQAPIFAASTEMRSDRYCDSLGNNCSRAGSFTFPVCTNGQTLIADTTGAWQCSTVATPPPPPPPPPPKPTGTWYQARNVSCTTYCSSIGKTSANDPSKGTMCASGESGLDPAFGIAMTYPYGTWGSMSGDVGGHYQTGGGQLCTSGGGGRNGNGQPVCRNIPYFCYANGQKQDGDTTDISVGCFCK